VTSRDPGTAASGGATTATGGLGTVTLDNLGTVLGGVDVKLNAGPRYTQPTLAAVATAVHTTVTQAWSGTAANLTLPSEAQGTALAATIEWGDGTTSDAEVTGTGSARTVTGTHTYPAVGSFTAKVRVRDAYGPVLAGTDVLFVVRNVRD